MQLEYRHFTPEELSRSIWKPQSCSGKPLVTWKTKQDIFLKIRLGDGPATDRWKRKNAGRFYLQIHDPQLNSNQVP